MEPGALLDFLVELAEGAGIRVRVVPRAGAGGEGEPSPRSGLCRIRGEPWLLLVAAEPLEDRIEAAAQALRRAAGPKLEGRYLPPAVRARLEEAGS